MATVVKPIAWTKRALKDLNQITKFNVKALDKEKAIELANKIIDFPKILENPDYDFKNIGTYDESFSHLKREYRKIFYGNYKITYRNGESKIYITRVFDTRQNPNKNK